VCFSLRYFIIFLWKKQLRYCILLLHSGVCELQFSGSAFSELRGMVFVVSVSTGLFTGIPSTKKPYRAAPDGQPVNRNACDDDDEEARYEEPCDRSAGGQE
jgi:hypothetical protein